MAKKQRSAAQKAATKRMLAAAAERRAAMGTGPAKRSKKSAKKGKKSPKALSKSGASSLGHAAHGYTLKRVSKGASDAARLSALEHNQNVMVHGLSAVAQELKVHRAALVGAGLLSMRGKAGR
jgi:hypothetical protein